MCTLSCDCENGQKQTFHCIRNEYLSVLMDISVDCAHMLTQQLKTCTKHIHKVYINKATQPNTTNKYNLHVNKNNPSCTVHVCMYSSIPLTLGPTHIFSYFISQLPQFFINTFNLCKAFTTFVL